MLLPKKLRSPIPHSHMKPPRRQIPVVNKHKESISSPVRTPPSILTLPLRDMDVPRSGPRKHSPANRTLSLSDRSRFLPLVSEEIAECWELPTVAPVVPALGPRAGADYSHWVGVWRGACRFRGGVDCWGLWLGAYGHWARVWAGFFVSWWCLNEGRGQMR